VKNLRELFDFKISRTAYAVKMPEYPEDNPESILDWDSSRENDFSHVREFNLLRKDYDRTLFWFDRYLNIIFNGGLNVETSQYLESMDKLSKRNMSLVTLMYKISFSPAIDYDEIDGLEKESLRSRRIYTLFKRFIRNNSDVGKFKDFLNDYSQLEVCVNNENFEDAIVLREKIRKNYIFDIECFAPQARQ